MAVTKSNAFGELLRGWRVARRMSQLDLGLESEVSARHISFIETGRAKPSREMVLLLASVLNVPIRERNILLQAAGFAAVYHETDLDDPQMAQVRQALQLLLKQQDPYPAVAFDRRWDAVMGNATWINFQRLLFGDAAPDYLSLTVLPAPRPNMMRMLFDPNGWRPHILNWESVAKNLLARLHREALWNRDEASRLLLKELLAYPEVPARWREPDYEMPQAMLIPVEMRFGEHTLQLFSTVTTLGSPQDITLHELHIETFHPVDEKTDFIIHAAAAAMG